MTRYALLAFAAVSVSASADEIWVGRYFEDTVSRLDLSGATLGSMTVAKPLGMTMGPDGKVYVCSETGNSVLKFDQTGTALGTFANTHMNNPTGILFTPDGKALVDNFTTNNVVRFSSAGTYETDFVPAGSGGLNGPDIGMVYGPDHNLYVASWGSNKVLKFDAATGAYLGDFVTGIGHPRGLTFWNSHLLVSSENGNLVNEYNAATGAFESILVSAGSGGLNGAAGMAVVGNDLYVASWRNGSVLKYAASNGAFEGVFAGGLGSPVTLQVVPEPAGLVPILAGAAFLLRRRRRASR
ncbi:MAG TPA: PEP-CTERM sorting domain-containing protein [Fimbriimonadaceae bacterium]|nr:PEP-CTERM sorting domain-containing protein [Fimbriimonadaceae bacterium]